MTASEKRWVSTCPGLGTASVPIEPAVSPDYFESIQAGLASGALSHFPLSEQEVLVRHTFRVIDAAVRAG